MTSNFCLSAISYLMLKLIVLLYWVTGELQKILPEVTQFCVGSHAFPVPSEWWNYLCLQYNEKAYSSSYTHKEKDLGNLHGFFGNEGTESSLRAVWAGVQSTCLKFIAAMRRNSRGLVFFHLEVAVHSVKQWKHKLQFQSPFLPLPSITQNFIPQEAPPSSIAVWVSKTKQSLFSRDDQDGIKLLLESKQHSLIWREIAFSRNVLFPNLTNLHKSI